MGVESFHLDWVSIDSFHLTWSPPPPTTPPAPTHPQAFTEDKPQKSLKQLMREVLTFIRVDTSDVQEQMFNRMFLEKTPGSTSSSGRCRTTAECALQAGKMQRRISLSTSNIRKVKIGKAPHAEQVPLPRNLLTKRHCFS